MKIILRKFQIFFLINYFFRIAQFLLRSLQNGIQLLHNILLKIQRRLIIQERFSLRDNEALFEYKLLIQEGCVEKLYFPKIDGLSLGGQIDVQMRPIEVYKFRDVSFTMNSDFIRFNDKSVFCNKLTRFERIFNDCGDVDFIESSGSQVSLRCYTKQINCDYVFHLTGCFSKVWTHFLAQYYPKLQYLNLACESKNYGIILPVDIDTHILAMVENFIKDFNNIKVIFVTNDTQVCCKELIYVSLDTWLSDMSKIKTIFHIQISDNTTKFILNQVSKIQLSPCVVPKEGSNGSKKRIFIGRTGKRNIENYNEVLKYFESLGFMEIYPHSLTFQEKIDLFSSAEIIAGPLSSGFLNMIFCKNQPKIIAMINLSRHDDMFYTKFADYMGIEFQTLVGIEKSPGNSDSDFYIDIEELKFFLSRIMLN